MENVRMTCNTSDLHRILVDNLTQLNVDDPGSIALAILSKLVEDSTPPPAVRVDECWFCGLRRSDEKKLYICGKCASEKRIVKALYCSRRCQKKHWHDHKKEHKSEPVEEVGEI